MMLTFIIGISFNPQKYESSPASSPKSYQKPLLIISILSLPRRERMRAFFPVAEAILAQSLKNPSRRERLSVFIHVAEKEEKKWIQMDSISFAGTQISTYLCGKGIQMITTTYSAFRSHLKEYLDKVTDDAESVVINREGDKAVVIISMEEYESMQETQYILSSPKVMAVLASAEKDIQDGNYQVVDPYEL